MESNVKTGSEAFKITGDWDAQSKLLKEKYSQLTDSDLKFEPGKESELLGRIGTRLNKRREEVVTMLSKKDVAKA